MTKHIIRGSKKKGHKTSQTVSKYYPAEDQDVESKPRNWSSRKVNQINKTRSSISPGTILILLAGRFRGKRVVCLKILESGLLLVSGPFKINGVPLRRVNSSYVIATSTKLDVSSIDVSFFDDMYFSKKTPADNNEFFLGDEPIQAIVSDQRKEDQGKIDNILLQIIKKVPMLGAYLKARFTLRKNDKPHKMRF